VFQPADFHLEAIMASSEFFLNEGGPKLGENIGDQSNATLYQGSDQVWDDELLRIIEILERPPVSIRVPQDTSYSRS